MRSRILFPFIIVAAAMLGMQTKESTRTETQTKSTTNKKTETVRTSSERKRIEVSSGFECDPSACIDMTMTVVSVHVTPIAQTVLDGGQLGRYTAWRDQAIRAIEDKLKEKYRPGGEPKTVEKHCKGSCTCTKMFEVDKDNPKEIDINLHDITRYYTGDGNARVAAEGSAFEVKYKVTIHYKYYGYLGICHEDDFI